MLKMTRDSLCHLKLACTCLSLESDAGHAKRFSAKDVMKSLITQVCPARSSNARKKLKSVDSVVMNCQLKRSNEMMVSMMCVSDKIV